MITTLFIAVVVSILTTIFSILPQVNSLPPIGGYDIDTALSNGMGMVNHFMADVWPIEIVFQGALFLFAYFGIKMILKFLLGSRAPGAHG